MSNELGLGSLITNPTARRDAVHIAVIPMVAHETFSPGALVALMWDTANTAIHGVSTTDSIGIVDPYLRYAVHPGERFWCFLFPGTVTGMRHEWQLGALPEGCEVSGVVNHAGAFSEGAEVPDTPETSRLWLEKFCDEWGFSLNRLLTICESGDGYVTAHGYDLHSAGELGEDYEIMWRHIENVTGEQFPESHRESVGWSCSC